MNGKECLIEGVSLHYPEVHPEGLFSGEPFCYPAFECPTSPILSDLLGQGRSQQESIFRPNSGSGQCVYDFQACRDRIASPLPKQRQGRPRNSDGNTPPKKKPRTSQASPTTIAPSPLSHNSDPDSSHSGASTRAGEESKPSTKDDDTMICRRSRNREAARKCRIRKQQNIQKLEAEAAVAETANKYLHEEVVSLRDETLWLKEMILRHSGCNCPLVQEYLKNQSAQIVAQHHSAPSQT